MESDRIRESRKWKKGKNEKKPVFCVRNGRKKGNCECNFYVNSLSCQFSHYFNDLYQLQWVQHYELCNNNLKWAQKGEKHHRI